MGTLQGEGETGMGVLTADYTNEGPKIMQEMTMYPSPII